tara:strand:- start:1566 stop:1931 length:366 start_codon:yes stop_codon:yes gene_type:complete
MTAHKNDKHTKTKHKSAAPPAIDFDATEFLHFLEGTDWSDEQKTEYITLVWEIVFDLVMCGVSVNAPDTAQNACGKLFENGADEDIQARAVVNSSHGQLIETFARLSPNEGGSDEKEVTDE